MNEELHKVISKYLNEDRQTGIIYHQINIYNIIEI